jgi:hypothetical protein
MAAFIFAIASLLSFLMGQMIGKRGQPVNAAQ